MKIVKTASIALVLATSLSAAAVAQNTTRNVGTNNVGSVSNVGNNNIGGNNIGVPPEPCRFNCYGGGTREQVIGGVIGGIITGIIAGSANRRNNQQQNVQPQPIQQQPIQPQPIQTTQQATGQHSQEHYQWCLNRYKSYKIATNSFTAYSGETRYCNSPFN